MKCEVIHKSLEQRRFEASPAALHCTCDCCTWSGDGTHYHYGDTIAARQDGCLHCGGHHECPECGEAQAKSVAVIAGKRSPCAGCAAAVTA